MGYFMLVDLWVILVYSKLFEFISTLNYIKLLNIFKLFYLRLS
jgi:hypothetical protein